ncbi:coiled-coil domain-containing protein 30 [Aegotheles albertisi]
MSFYRGELEGSKHHGHELNKIWMRLLMATEEVQRLTDKLDAQRSRENRTELQEAMEHKSRLDKEMLALRARVQTLDLERKVFLDLVEQLKEEISEYQRSEKQELPLPVPAEAEEVTASSLQITNLDTESLGVQKNKSEMSGQEQALSGAQEMQESLLDKSFQQQEEKMQQLQQDLRHVQTLCSSAERELRYEREKNVSLQKENLLLQQECTKVKAELKQARAKLMDTTEMCSSLSAQWEKSQQKVKELEEELLKCSKAEKHQSSLQEKLEEKESQVCEAQRKISKLHRKLKDSQHQLLLAEACVSDKKLLEEELKEARDNEARVQRELHEEQLKRKLLEQQVEELRQQLWHSQEMEASLAKMKVELQAKTPHVLEDERKTDSSKHLQCQKENQKLSEELSLLKEENKALYEEGVRLLNQKDLYVRKYNEMQLHHKDKIRRAKETFIHEVKQRDGRIKQLENELSESKLHVEKGKVLIAQISAENEKLLQERRRLLQKITDQEETPWSNGSTIATLQSRVKILDEESKLQVSGHVPTLQRVPRSIHAPNMEDLKNVDFSEHQPQRKVLPSPHARSPSGDPLDSLSTRKAMQDTKPEGEAASQDLSFCSAPSQHSEMGYLNVELVELLVPVLPLKVKLVELVELVELVVPLQVELVVPLQVQLVVPVLCLLLELVLVLLLLVVLVELVLCWCSWWWLSP